MILEILASLSLISIPIIKGCWILYILGSLLIIAVYSFLSWKNFGLFTFFGKLLAKSEFVTYFTLTLGAMLLIFIG